MRIVTYLSIASLVAGALVLPFAVADPLNCEGVFGLVRCVRDEVYRDVGIVLGLVAPVVNAACDIVFGYYPCIYINGGAEATVPVLP